MARGLPPVYDRAALKSSTEEETRAFEEEGRSAWRFLWNSGRPRRKTRSAAPEINAASVSDPVLIREDGTPLYILHERGR